MNKVSTLCALAVAFLGISGSAFGQFPRNVVIEEFTSATCGPCKDATPIINDLIKDNPGRVFSVRYHMNIPSPGDPWYVANKAENDRRKTDYKVNGIPASRVNGLGVMPTEKGEMVQRVSDAMAVTADVKLEVTQALEGGKIKVTVKATASDNGITGMTLMVAAVEGLIHVEDPSSIPNTNHEKDFQDVFRKMVSGMDGTSIDLSPGQSKTYNFEYTLGDDWQQTQMYTVAWVQDGLGDVLQAGASAKLASGVDESSSIPSAYSLGAITPNPIQDRGIVHYSLGGPEQVSIEVHDITGSLVATFDKGEHEIGTFQTTLDLSGLSSGVYFYTIHAGSYRETKMMTVAR